MEKVKNVNKKKLMTFIVLGVFAMALTSAALVQYYSQAQVTMSVESPVVFNGESMLNEQVNLLAGNGSNLYLVEGENMLNRDINVEFKFSLLDGEGNELVDTSGFYLAYSDDIQYAYDELYGNSTNWEEAKTWMDANLDWFDWYLTGDLIDYDSSVITNHGGNSAYSNVLEFNQEIPEDLSPGKFYAIVYFDIDESVLPGEYTLSVDIMPTA